MTTTPVTSITDELLAELEQLAGKVSAMALDSAEEVVTQSGRMIECPVCCGEGYASAENDYCNFDNHAIGVEFYGIGPEFGLAEAYFRAASPATILALLQHVRELSKDRDRLDWLADPANQIGNVQLPTEAVMQNLHSLRDAIDAARSSTS
jgi:hypothetical protein